MLKIHSLNHSGSHWEDVVDIFFESSPKKDFNSQAEKDEFLYKYLGHYKENHPTNFLVALKDKEVLGYICGSHNSLGESILYKNLPHYNLFEDLYEDFPAHLHINTKAGSRGLGVGSDLLRAYENLCPGKGVHLITSPQARNRSFYIKNNYDYQCTRKFRGLELHFMGKTL